MKIYLIGSLSNTKIPDIANQLEHSGKHTVFADWYGAGYEADIKWKEYEQKRGRTYVESLDGYNARHVFEFDHYHIMAADAVVLVQPAGKSGHLEFGYAVGKGKRGYILLDDKDVKWDMMLCFATKVFENLEQLKEYLG